MSRYKRDHFSSGRVFQINVSLGGVPKLARQQAKVDFSGIIGDGHAHPKVHGGVERAICLYPLEHILALQIEGHPVFPGALGENITVVNVDWTGLVPQARFELGQQVIIEITRYTTPCKTIVPYFLHGEIKRISQDDNPGWSRVYARILQGGVLTAGDPMRRLD